MKKGLQILLIIGTLLITFMLTKTINVMQDTEKWMPVPGYEGYYEVSDLGNLRNLGRRKTPRLLKPYLANHGYYTVALQRAGNYKTCLLHRVVMMSFKGIDNTDVDHINGDKSDNRLINLRTTSHRENCHFYRSTNKSDKTSKFIGVSKDNISLKWVARIAIGGRYRYLGKFNTEAEAHEAYQEKLKSVS